MAQRIIYEFDDFRVDTGQFLLMKDGHPTAITPTVFRILLALLERPGQIVAKDELMKFVWPDSYVEEGNLNRNVSTLRKILNEKPCDHKYIETVPKTGYRFIAPVRSIDYQPPAGPVRKAASANVCHIVGRDNELAELRRGYDLARQGQGGLVCVTGDAGIGKTALVDTFLDDLLQNGQTFHLARSRCSESLTDSEPFIPWIEALGALAEEQSIQQVMQNTAPAWHSEISHAGSGAPGRMKRELVDFCKQISAVHPLVVVIDDFHWADLGSIDLLAFLASRLDSARTLVILCYRVTEMKINAHPFLQIRSDLLSCGACTEVQLRPLSKQDVETHLALEYPQEQFAEDYPGFVHAKTDGNPLFIRELVRGKWQLADSVRNVIRRKIESLDDTNRQLLVTASVQGREFDSAVLARSLNLAAEDVEETLNFLAEGHGLIERIREQQLPDGKFTVRYRFVYGFYQEVCYESLEPTRKASLNASLAEAFLTYYGN
jgi:predicted ATPase